MRNGNVAKKRQISPEQMAAMTSHLYDKDRPVQPRDKGELLLVSMTRIAGPR